MLQTIRARLVASFAGLTLLTVLLVGFLAQGLMSSYVEQQERAALAGNAEAIARQATPLFWPTANVPSLEQLVHTTSFLGNVQVRILDARGNLLADSGAESKPRELAWLVPDAADQLDMAPSFAPGIFLALPERSDSFGSAGGTAESWIPLEDQAGRLSVYAVRQAPGIWGSRFTVELVEAKPAPPTRGSAPTPLVPEAEPSGLLGLVYGNTGPEAVAERSEMEVRVPIQRGVQTLGYVELGNGPAIAAGFLHTFRRTLIVAGLGAGVLAVVVGLVVSRGLTFPLLTLTAATRRMSGEDLSVRAPLGAGGEIGELARQFNRMAERLQASFNELAAERDTLRRFIGDASHELRTPIMAIGQFIELLQGPAAEDPAARREFLDESALQLERLAWITGHLLDLSRLDAHLVDLILQEEEVDELVAAVAAPFRVLAAEGQNHLALQPPPPGLRVSCDRARLERALSNLVDNGLKYSGPGGQVSLGAEQREEGICFWVEDDGPGIGAGDLPHIFERFYRGANTTRPGGKVAGSGLGLAIVKSIVEAHGGRVWVENDLAGQGCRFSVLLPDCHRTRS